MDDLYYENNYTSDAEWDREEAGEIGFNNQDQQWVCTGRDVWHENPFYKGEAQPHPEMQE